MFAALLNSVLNDSYGYNSAMENPFIQLYT